MKVTYNRDNKSCVPAILSRQLASDNISHHGAELTWWQLVSTL